MARQQLPMLGKSSIQRGISDALIGLYDLAPLVSYQWIEGVKDRRQWLNQIGPVLLLLLFYSSIHLLLYYFSSSSVQSRSVHIYPCPTCKWLIVVSIHLCASAAHWLAHSLCQWQRLPLSYGQQWGEVKLSDNQDSAGLQDKWSIK